jgi:HAD superfamily hydrolase (TIGR01549 family)
MNSVEMNSHGVVFDCDGTLIDSLGQAFASFNYALEKVGHPARTPEEIKRYFGASADRILLNLLGDESLSLKAFEHYMAHQLESAKQTRLHGGIRELLDRLKKAQVPMAVVTGRHARDLEIVLRPHQLGGYFAAMIADSHLPKPKPAPDGILKAAHVLGLAPRRILYVGDSPLDIQAAHAAGSVAVAALWDAMARREEMLRHRPEYLARTPDQVWTFFQEFASR